MLRSEQRMVPGNLPPVDLLQSPRREASRMRQPSLEWLAHQIWCARSSSIEYTFPPTQSMCQHLLLLTIPMTT